MKRDWIKVMVGKLATTMTALLFLVLVPATAAGSLPVWAALLLGCMGVVALNAACGILLARRGEIAEKPLPRRCVQAPHPVPLRVVRGGRAA